MPGFKNHFVHLSVYTDTSTCTATRTTTRTEQEANSRNQTLGICRPKLVFLVQFGRPCRPWDPKIASAVRYYSAWRIHSAALINLIYRTRINRKGSSHSRGKYNHSRRRSIEPSRRDKRHNHKTKSQMSIQKLLTA